MHSATLRTCNEAWGFYGTCAGITDVDAAWHMAFEAVAQATGASPEGVRDFLDSRHGRHFADDFVNGLHQGLELHLAIAGAVRRWMRWKIDRSTSRVTGIPQGLPYLTGFVGHCEIMAEAA